MEMLTYFLHIPAYVIPRDSYCFVSGGWGNKLGYIAAPGRLADSSGSLFNAVDNLSSQHTKL